MTKLISVGFVIVVPSGNQGVKYPLIDGYPALLASEFPIIVVGGSDNGAKADFSQAGPLVDLYAPATDISIPSLNAPFVACGSGTSYSSPTVAGLVAYLMSVQKYQEQINAGGLGKVAENMKVLVKSLAYPREDGSVPIVYNGVDWTSIYHTCEQDSCEANWDGDES